MLRVRVDQIDNNGTVYKSFRFSRTVEEIPGFLERVRMAFNMAHTKVYADKKQIAGPHDFIDDGRDPGNCGVCHFVHTDRRIA